MIRQIAYNTFLFIFIFSLTIYSQSWEWVHPKPQGNNLNSIKNIDQNNLIAVGDYGTILKTSDAGQSWQIIESGVEKNLNSVFVVDVNNIWIAGDNGVILKSTNGGYNWNLLNINTDMNLNSIVFVNSENGFCAGGKWDYSSTSSILLKTTNGGSDWFEINLETQYPLNSIHFVDINIGFICGGVPASNGYENSAVFLKTTNSGLTWDIQSFDFPNLTSLYFVDENIGYITTHSRFYFKTTDGGTNWNMNEILTTMKDTFFQDENIGWIVGGGGGGGARIFHTTNGGVDWQIQIEWGSGSYSSFYDLQYINSDISYLVGYGGEIRKTTNSGATWNFLTNRYFSNSRNYFFLNSNLGWAITGTNIYRTTNRGLNWANYPLPSGIPSGMNDLKFNDENFGYGIRVSNVFTSTDRGENWNEFNIISSGLNLFFKSIYQWDELHGIVWGEYFLPFNGQEGNMVARTTNGWNTYTVDFIPGNHLNSGTAFSNYAWAVGPDGLILRSTDYGESWENINTSFSQNLYIISVLNASNVWIVGNHIILKSVDTGITWEEITIPGDYSYQDIRFLDENHGWLLASENWNSSILYTQDGGNSWETLILKSVGYLNSIKVTNDNYLFAFGDNGKILVTQNLINDIITYGAVSEFNLVQNYPNPFNPTTTIRFTISDVRFTILKVYDVLGKEVATLVNEEKPAGNYEVEFNGTGLPSGIYFYQLRTSNFVETKKMVFLK